MVRKTQDGAFVKSFSPETPEACAEAPESFRTLNEGKRCGENELFHVMNPLDTRPERPTIDCFRSASGKYVFLGRGPSGGAGFSDDCRSYFYKSRKGKLKRFTLSAP